MSKWVPASSRINVDDPRAIALLEAIKRTHPNGGGIIHCFESAETAAVIRLPAPSLLQDFLRCSVVKRDIPELDLTDGSSVEAEVSFNAFEFEGSLVWLLLFAGAYYPGMVFEKQARKVARDFVDLVAEGQHQYLMAFRIDGALSDWFYDIAWDCTFVVCNLQTKKWWVICTTDTD